MMNVRTSAFRRSLVVALCAGAATPALAQVGTAREHYLEFFADTSVSNAFGGLYVNGAGDVLLLNQRFGSAGTTVVINKQVVYESGADPDVNAGTIPEHAGLSLDGGWAYHSFFGITSNQIINTDAGIILTEGDEFMPGLFAADSVYSVRMADNGDIFAVVDLGDAPGNDTDRAMVRVRDYRTNPTFDIILQGGTTVAGTDVGGGLTVGSNSSLASLQAAGGISDTYNISQNGRYMITGADVQGTGITTANDKSVILTDMQTGTSSVVLREGTPTGGGDNFDNLGFSYPQLHVNNSGSTLVAGDTDGPTNADAFLAFNGDIVAREGEMHDGFTLASLGSTALNNLDQHVSVWSTDGGEALFFGTGDGDLTRIIGVGDQFEYFDDLEGEFLMATIDDILSDPIALSDDGIAYIQVEFTDGVGFTEFFGVIEVTVIPAPAGMLGLAAAAGLVGIRRRRSA